MKTFFSSLLLLVSFILTFSSFAGGGGSFVNPPSGMPPCAVNPAPGNTACQATPICNPHGFCGTTSSSYTANYWSQLNSQFCGSIENNAFLSFTAESSTISFDCYVYNCNDDEAIQIMIFSAANCGSGAVTSHVCVNEMYARNTPYNVTANGLTPGQQYYIMIDGFGGDVCDYTFVATDGVALPVGIDIGSSITVCNGETVTATAYGGNGVYTWDSSPYLNTTSGEVVTITPPGIGSYQFTANSSGGVPNCPVNNSFTTTVNVVACCTINTNVTNVSCNTNGTYSANVEITFSSPPTTGNLIVNGPNGPHATVAAPYGGSPYTTTINNIPLGGTSNFTSYFTNNVNCTHVLTYTAPQMPTFDPITACQNTTAPALPTTSNNGITGTWSPATINTSTAGTGVYTFIPTGGQNCQATQSITINPLPNISTINSVLLDCATENGVNLTASSTTPGVTYNWTDDVGGSGGIVSGSTTNSTIVNAPGDYILTVTDPTTGCTKTENVTVMGTNNTPQITVIHPPVGLTCAHPQDTIQVSAVLTSGSGNPLNYQWTTTGGTIVSGSTTQTVILNQPGIYTFTVTDAINGCTAFESFNVTGDLALPVVTPITPEGIRCDHIWDTISGNSNVTNPSYSWTTTNGAIVGQQDQHVVVSTAGTYTFNVTNLDNGCSTSVNVVVTGDTVLPNVEAGPSMNICPSSSVTLQGSSSTPGVNYSWSANANGVTVDNFSTSPTPTVPNAAWYYLTVTNPSNNCSATDSVQIIQITPPTIFGDSMVCSSSFTAPAGSVSNPVAGTWSVTPANSGTFTPSTSVTNPTFTPNTGITNVTLNYTNECGTVNSQLLFPPNPVIAQVPAYTCNDMSQEIKVTTLGGGYWSVIDNPATTWHEDTAIVITPSANIGPNETNAPIYVSSHPTPGTYTLVFTDTLCNYTASATVNMIGYPWTDIKDTTLCYGTEHQFNAIEGPHTDSYSWNTGANGKTLTVNEAGTYTVTAENQCYSYSASAVVAYMVCDIEAPNIISLSSQAGNNIWYVNANGINKFNCVIVNRWGNVIYQFDEATGHWDGKDKAGNIVPEGVYFYKIETEVLGGQELKKHGFIHVVH